MSLINWIFDIYQHKKVDAAHREATEARREIDLIRQQGSKHVDGERLVHALEELALSVKTVQRMLLEKGVCTQAELGALLRKIDREDGREDGRSPLD